MSSTFERFCCQSNIKFLVIRATLCMYQNKVWVSSTFERFCCQSNIKFLVVRATLCMYQNKVWAQPLKGFAANRTSKFLVIRATLLYHYIGWLKNKRHFSYPSPVRISPNFKAVFSEPINFFKFNEAVLMVPCVSYIQTWVVGC